MNKRKFGLLILAMLLAGAPLLAQFGGAMPAFTGVWNPVVGSGAVYEMTGKDKVPHQMTIAIVGKETFDGKEGFWVEMMFEERGQPMVIQTLKVKDGEVVKDVRSAFQMGDRPPMEMSGMMAGMMGGRGTPAPALADLRTTNEHIGMESVTTPTGTMQADHWKKKDGSGEAWLSPAVPPWGLVKSIGKDNTMVVIKVLTDAKSHFNGKPVPFDPSVFMGRGQGQ
jgi:hypothetical protein